LKYFYYLFPVYINPRAGELVGQFGKFDLFLNTLYGLYMLVKARYFLLLSIFLFIVAFITLSDSRFGSNPILEGAGQIITIVMVLSIFVNLILTAIDVVKKIQRYPPKPEEKQSPTEEKFVRTKNLIGRLLLLWLLVIFPIIGMSLMVNLSTISESGGRTPLDTVLFFITALTGTLYLSPLILCIFPLYLFSFYFLFSQKWHRWRDPIFACIIFILLILQIWGFVLLITT
jgi:hypothetical protein